MAACGSPQAVLALPEAALRQWVGPAVARALVTEPELLAERLAAACAWLEGGPQRHVLTLGDPAYPARLLQTVDPPLLLYVQGEIALLG